MTTTDPYAEFRDPGPEEDGLARLRRLAMLQVELEARQTEAAAALRAATEALTDVSDRQIPDLMDELGYEGDTKLVVDDYVVALKSELRFSVPKDRREEAYDWLERNDLGGVVKRHVGADFGVGEEERARAAAGVEALARAAGVEVEIVRKVEPGTLGKVLRDLLREGEDVPLDMFGAWRERRAKVTRKKES